jgi:polysaccharide pyruvyl transferase WcaK-like protein
MLGWYLVSKLSSTPILCFSVGTERDSKSTFFYALVLKLFLGQAKQVYLRDLDSRDAIHRLTGFVFDTAPDAVYLSHKSMSPISITSKSSQSIVFVSKQSKTDEEIQNYWNLVINAIKHNTINTSLVISASSEQDFKSAKEFYKHLQRLGFVCQLEIAQDFQHFLQQIKSADIIISSRMHPLIYAHLLGKSFVAVPTNQKTKSMASFLIKNSAEFLAVDVKRKLLDALENKINSGT